MKSFIRKIFDKENDESVHSQFVRFGKGKYSNRAVLSLNKSDKIKARGSFEYANDFAMIACELGKELEISGKIMSKISLKDLIGGLGTEDIKRGLFVYEVAGKVDGEKLKEILKKAYISLLDIETAGIVLKTKKKLPKPGKGGEGKVDDKFCQLEADSKFWPGIKEAFYWDVEGKKAQVLHDFIIEDIVMPNGEKDFEKIRIMSKRKGKITRRCIVDKQEKRAECEFEA